MADGIRHLYMGANTLMLEQGHIIESLLRPGSNPGHGLHRFQRIRPRGCFPAEHNSVGTVKDGVGHIVGFCPGSPVVGNHAFQHLGSCNHRLPQLVALGNNLFLDNGHIFHGNLYPQIPPGHHNTVGHLENLIDVVHAFLVFNLGNNPHGGANPFQQTADFHNVPGIAHKGCRHIVHALLGSEGNVVFVLFGHKGQLQESPRHCHPFPGGDFPTVDDDGINFLVGGGLDFQGQFPIIQEDFIPFADFRRQAGIIYMGLFCRSFYLVHRQRKVAARH